jgi:FkbM family methyltransferase
MSPPTHQVNNPESEQLQIAALEIAQVRSDLGKILAAHRQFGQLEPAPGGLRNKVARLLKKATRRPMRWYTGNQHVLQGAIYRLLHDIAGILEAHENALLDLGVRVEEIRGRLRAVEYSLQHIRMSGRIYQAVQEMDSPDPVVSEAAWGVNLPNTVTASDLFYCFRLLLDRIPDRDEWIAHYSRVGENLSKVVTAFLNSHEFAKRRLLERAPEQRELVELTNFKMYVSPDDDYIGGSIIREREYEPHMTGIFQQFVRPKMQVLDVGANMGYFSLLAASLVGSTGHVYSWEPSPENVKLLLASKQLNQFSNIEIVQAAAGARSGLLKYFPNFSNGLVMEIGEERPEEAVPAETVMALRIDDYVPHDAKIGFIKIDVEGFEYEALSGAMDTIRRNLPIIATEFGPKALLRASGISGEEFLQFFVRLGYDISVIDKYNLVPGNVADVLRHYESSDVDHIDLLLRPRSDKA